MRKKLPILLFIVLLVCLGIFLWLKGISQKIFLPHNQSQASSPSIATDFQSNTPFNILLLGYGGGNHDGAYLTDSMMVVHVDPSAKKILLVSIPRDIWIKIPTDGEQDQYWKINTAYTIGMDDKYYPNKQTQFTGSDGGGRLAEYITQQVTGLSVNNFVGMDFTGFTKTIDTLGGVDITVEQTFDDYKYPIEGHEDDNCGLDKDTIDSLSAQIATGSASENVAFPCRYEHLHFDKGVEHMDGATALKYTRSRHGNNGEGTDFTRSKRQRNLLVAVKKQIMSVGFVSNAIPFITSLQDDLKTDLTIDDVKTFTEKANELDKYQIQSIAITDQNYLDDSTSSDGQFILVPKEGKDNWTQIQNWIASYTNPNYEITSPVIQVSNGSGVTGLAGLATNRLKEKGLTVLDPTTEETRDTQKTTITIYGRNIASSTLTQIKQEFLEATIQKVQDTNDSYDILIILGTDYNLKQGKKILNE